MMNGDGLRVVLWLSGCEHHCMNCQNLQTWDMNSGISFDISAKEELFYELQKDYISGITFSGGDPLHENNIQEVLQIIKDIRNFFPNKTIWLYTGFSFDEIFSPTFLNTEQNVDLVKKYVEQYEIRKQIVSKCDVVVDGRYIDYLREVNAKWRGSTNQRVIDVPKTLQSKQVVLYCD